jgi:hypothetical protein
MILAGIILYFGALLIPAAYFIILGREGSAKKGLLVGVALQIFWSLAVWSFVYYSWHTGYTDYYYGWWLLMPVNLISAFYYLGFLIWKVRKRPNQHSRLPP